MWEACGLKPHGFYVVSAHISLPMPALLMVIDVIVAIAIKHYDLTVQINHITIHRVSFGLVICVMFLYAMPISLTIFLPIQCHMEE